uniref:Uncharacterized protein n=1 Tax=Rhizophora mucronata TaxID=61149 RepID=A0A2P2PRR9_RHIMU
MVSSDRRAGLLSRYHFPWNKHISLMGQLHKSQLQPLDQKTI